MVGARSVRPRCRVRQRIRFCCSIHAVRAVLCPRNEALSSKSAIPGSRHPAVQPRAIDLRGERSAVRDGERQSGTTIRRQRKASCRVVLSLGQWSTAAITPRHHKGNSAWRESDRMEAHDGGTEESDQKDRLHGATHVRLKRTQRMHRKSRDNSTGTGCVCRRLRHLGSPKLGLQAGIFGLECCPCPAFSLVRNPPRHRIR